MAPPLEQYLEANRRIEEMQESCSLLDPQDQGGRVVNGPHDASDESTASAIVSLVIWLGVLGGVVYVLVQYWRG